MTSTLSEINIEIISLEKNKAYQKKLLEQGRSSKSYFADIKDGRRNYINENGEIHHTIPVVTIKDYQTNYIVSYPRLMFGDFIQWLINQHDNFPHWQKMQIKPCSPVSHNFSWPHVSITPRWLYFLDDLDNVCIGYGDNDDKNFSVSKFTSKIFLSDKENASFQMSDEIGYHFFDSSTGGLEKIRSVVPNTKCIQLQIEDLSSDAFRTYTKRTYGDGGLNSQRIMMIQEDLELSDFVLYVDKIFALDDGEYKRLLEFIEEDPIDNWKELVKIYTENVISF